MTARTYAEDMLAGQLIASGVAFVREHVFALPRRWRFDFALDDKLAIEVEGGIWMRGGGAHSRPANIERDIEKHNAATLLGWRVLRVTPKMVKSGQALDLVMEARK